MTTNGTAKRGLAGWVRAIVAVAIVGLLTGVSLWVYTIERSNGQTQILMGDSNSPDRLDIAVFVQKVDASAQELSAQVEVHPQGKLLDEQTGWLKHDLTIYTNAIKGDTLSFKQGKNISVSDLKMALHEGVVTDYPFDSYSMDFGFVAMVGTEVVPVSVTFVNADSFFKIKPGGQKHDGGSLEFSASASRSTGTMAFAIFIMVFMWGLSLAAVIAAWFATGGKRGLLWPSLSFMGALLFALVPLRNALPGAPPIGSVVDFSAFFMAEALISISLITTVVFGFHTERKNEKKKQQEEERPPSPPVAAPPPPPMAMTAPMGQYPPNPPMGQPGQHSGNRPMWTDGQSYPR
ncbi:DUF4436 domain-containing protein [Solihabitans fulvus]|uniref:DUF4436 domain-containing protein n=1 Tax=Solihabitans fulvus TaxID=1892852 RepID=A0A5B2X2Z4_9PSEU|nr:DUF4436 family protein [Solihabitans fulvus]KAA2257545.1 DUF4436 domain-containing protein [Solihabitans fulvus]